MSNDAKQPVVEDNPHNDPLLTEADEVAAVAALQGTDPDTTLLPRRRVDVDRTLARLEEAVVEDLAVSYPFNPAAGQKYDPSNPKSAEPTSGKLPRPFAGPNFIVNPTTDPTQVQVVHVNQPIGGPDQTQKIDLNEEPKTFDTLGFEPPPVADDADVEDLYPTERLSDDPDRLSPMMPLYEDAPLQTERTGSLVRDLTDLARCRKLLDQANYEGVMADVVECINSRDDAIKAAAVYSPELISKQPLSNLSLRGLITALEARLKKYQVALPDTLDRYRDLL